jgi:cytochrome c-type biogenesis protein CcmH
VRVQWWVRSAAVLLLMCLVLLAVGRGLAQEPSADEINEVARLLSCPTCTGINLADCPTETCAQWRAEIGRLLAEGKTQGEILDYFAVRYGDHVLQTPPARGVFIWVWLVPAAGVLGALVWWLVRSRGRQMPDRHAGPVVSGGEEVVGEYAARVEAELEKWEKG